MSGYTIGEIVVWLVAAAALGFVLGWLSRELRLRRRTRLAAGPVPVVREVPVPVVEEPAVPEPAEPEPSEPDPSEPEPAEVQPGPHPGSALPLDGGESPSPEYAVKVSKGSKIYHEPSSPSYGRTKAAVWFESAEAAEAAGFRKPKNT